MPILSYSLFLLLNSFYLPLHQFLLNLLLQTIFLSFLSFYHYFLSFLSSSTYFPLNLASFRFSLFKLHILAYYLYYSFIFCIFPISINNCFAHTVLKCQIKTTTQDSIVNKSLKSICYAFYIFFTCICYEFIE